MRLDGKVLLDDPDGDGSERVEWRCGRGGTSHAYMLLQIHELDSSRARPANSGQAAPAATARPATATLQEVEPAMKANAGTATMAHAERAAVTTRTPSSTASGADVSTAVSAGAPHEA
jgi:hypothetical protein